MCSNAAIYSKRLLSLLNQLDENGNIEATPLRLFFNDSGCWIQRRTKSQLLSIYCKLNESNKELKRNTERNDRVFENAEIERSWK